MSDPWYKDGLRFSCTQCGNCCTGAPGYVWVSDDEIAVLARRVGLDVAAFRARYTRAIRGRGRSLVEKRDHACAFYQPGVGCTVYADRPKQCRTWPFWRSNVESVEDWRSGAADCPGMDRGKLHCAPAIAASAADDGLP